MRATLLHRVMGIAALYLSALFNRSSNRRSPMGFPFCNACASNPTTAALHQTSTEGESDEDHVMVTVSLRRSQLPAYEAHSPAEASKETKSSQCSREARCHTALSNATVRARVLAFPHAVICPTGKSMSKPSDFLSRPVGKNISFRRLVETALLIRHPASQEGRFAVVTDVGCGMRWTWQRRVQSLHGRTALVRTAKSCGPDAPTLASSFAEQSAKRWWQTSPVTKESTKETVKTIARGMPGVSGVTVVTNARVFYTTRAAAGASGARHSLRPLM